MAWGQTPGAAPGLPGGANALQESYDDWRVACVSPQPESKICGASQEQADAKTHQRILAIELRAVAPDRLEGILALPFGLLLDRGVVLQIGDAAPGPALRFRTCLAMGCVVPLQFDAPSTLALRKGTAMTVKATTDDGRDITLSVSLKGLPNALDRLAALTRN